VELFGQLIIGLGPHVGRVHQTTSSPWRTTRRVATGSLAAASANASRAIFGGTLTTAHTNFGRLLRNRHIREDTDPNPTGAAYMASNRAARRLDLTRRDPARVCSLEPVGAEIQRRPAFGKTVYAALVRFAIFASLRT